MAAEVTCANMSHYTRVAFSLVKKADDKKKYRKLSRECSETVAVCVEKCRHYAIKTFFFTFFSNTGLTSRYLQEFVHMK